MAKDTKNEASEAELMDTDHAEARVYELGFHLEPELAESEAKKAYQAIRELIASVGTVVAEGEPTKLPLAYTISKMETTGRRDFDSAFFCWIAYETTGEGHDKIALAAKEESRIIRFLDIRTTKEEAKHAEEMEAVYASVAAAAAQDGEDDAVSEVELDNALKEAGV